MTSCVHQNRFRSGLLRPNSVRYDSWVNHLDWNDLQLLLAVAQAGSLRGAARQLDLSQPTLGRRLRRLEASLGAPLLVRHARGVHLTDQGEAVVAASQRLQAEVTGLRRALTGLSHDVAGRVRVSCTEPVASMVLPGTLHRLRATHPRLAVDVVVDAHATDLERRDADVAIRMFPPQRAALVGRRLATTHTAFYASTAYLERHGRPERLEDLLEHVVIGPDRDPLFVRQAESLGVSLDRLAYRTDAFSTVRAWVREGLAIGALLEPSARGLVQVLPPIAEHPVWLVTHPDLRGAATVAAVWDQLVADLPGAFAPPEPPCTSA